jgi:hypothetical protein
MYDTSEESHIARNSDWRSGAHADSLTGTEVDGASVRDATIDHRPNSQRCELRKSLASYARSG